MRLILEPRKDNKDQKAMVQVIEFILVFTIFVILLSAFFSAIATQLPSNTLKDVDTRMRADQICDTLVRDTGMMSDGDRNWELREYQEINYGNSPLKRVGLAKDENSYGVLSYAKIEALSSKLLYSRLSTIMNLPSGMLVNITITTLEPEDSETDLNVHWGGTKSINSKNFVSYSKIVAVDHGLLSGSGGGRKIEKAKLTVMVFYSGTIS